MRKNSIYILFICLVLVSVKVQAGQVFGSLLENEQPILEGTSIEITCNGNKFIGRTDRGGAYRIYLEGTGKCTFKVFHKKQEVSYEISSYSNPVRFDFNLVMQNGRYTLQRR